MNFTPTPAELRNKASLFWPAELTAREVEASIIPSLLETQEAFISLLHIADARPDAWKDVLQVNDALHANVFLKHLMILADVGGEPLKRLRPELPRLFPKGVMEYVWREKTFTYPFKAILQARTLDNKSLFVDGKGLQQKRLLDDRIEDMIMLLLHGASSVENSLPQITQNTQTILDKCNIGSLIGRKAELDTFVRQRYIWVSKITGGATSNALGQLAEGYVREKLQTALPDWTIRTGTIPGISHNAGRTDINFDLVAISPTNRYTAIEISFQVTTNSVIERKSGQAQARAALLHPAGHAIAYVIDGAGNFERAAALNTICRYSDCTITLTSEGMETLITFLQEKG